MITIVNAEEYKNITDDAEIRYRWYKEVTTGTYTPKKDIIETELVDINNIKYGDYSAYKEEYCTLSANNYEIERKIIYLYKRVNDTRYILLENFTYDDNIKIYSNNKQIEFQVESIPNNKVKINLRNSYETETLMFIITTNDNYKISLYPSSNFSKENLSKEIENEYIIIPDKTWITENTTYLYSTSETKTKNTDLKVLSETNHRCRYREIYVYKYNTVREYYDNNYYLNVDGYIKDTEDYKVFYKGEPIMDTVEIIKEKIVKAPQIEYVYIEPEKIETDSSKTMDCSYEIVTEVKEKEVFKTPKEIYIIIGTMTLIIIILIITLKKCRMKYLSSIVEDV